MNEPVARPGLLARVKGILLQPGREWEQIDREPATIGGLYAGYVAPLAAIPAICTLIGAVVFGYGFFGVTYKPPIMSAVTSAVVTYLLTLAGVYVLALIINALAPTFGGEKNQIQAFKVAAYSGTASWLAGVFNLIPMLAILGLLGLYSLFLLYRGLPKLMKTPEDKALPYTALVIVAAIVLALVVGAITAPLMAMGRGPLGVGGGGGGVSGNISVPGVGNVNLAELEEAGKRMERAAENPPQAVAPEVLSGMLPANVAGLARGATKSSAGGIEGLQGSSAEATYGADGSQITLSVSDLGAMGGLASLGGALNVQSSEDDGNRYEKVGKVNGRMTQEEYDRSARSGEYGVLVGDRFMVQARGEGVTIDQLRGAVNSVNAGRLEQLAR
jgi:hypothetical protein